MGYPEFAQMGSQSPWWNERVRVNYILGRRMASSQNFTAIMADARLSYALFDELDGIGAPADRTIREWVRLEPDLPERALRAQIISERDVLPWLLSYVRLEGDVAQMGWNGGEGPSQTRPASSGRGVLIGLGLAIGALFLASRNER